MIYAQAVLAQQGSEPFLNKLTEYGVLGILVALLFWFGFKQVQREQKRSDDLQAENLRLNQTIQDKVIPALVSATQALQGSAAILQQIKYERDLEMAEQRGVMARRESARYEVDLPRPPRGRSDRD